MGFLVHNKSGCSYIYDIIHATSIIGDLSTQVVSVQGMRAEREQELVEAFRQGLRLGWQEATQAHSAEWHHIDTPRSALLVSVGTQTDPTDTERVEDTASTSSAPAPSIQVIVRGEPTTSLPFYVVYSAPPDLEHVIGIHNCTWDALLRRFPEGRLEKSPLVCGVRDCKKFNNQDQAVEYFRRRSGAPAVVIFA